MNKFELGIFDLDGTIKNSQGIPHEVIDGFKNIHNQGLLTTIITGKGNAHLTRTLAENKSIFLSPGVPVGLENGGRIVDTSGSQNLAYHGLTTQEIDTFLSFVDNADIPFILYHPEDISEKAKIWTRSPEISSALPVKEEYYDIFSATVEALSQRLNEEHPCMMVFTSPDQSVRSALPESLNVVSNEGVLHINSSQVHKGSGVIDIAHLTNTHLSRVLIAGNDENDIPMFALQVGEKVLVGESLPSITDMHDVTTIASVTDLGLYLSSMGKI